MPSVMSNKKFLRELRKFIAVQAVGPSTVRGQSKGTLATIQEYLGRLRLERLGDMDCRDYARWLDAHTERLKKKLGGQERQWGVARKAINLFMRSCLYNTFLCRMFHLAHLQRYLEIPLDSAVAKGLRARARCDKLRLPPWPRLFRLTLEVSQVFQHYAEKHALRVGLPGRVFLDNELWLENR